MSEYDERHEAARRAGYIAGVLESSRAVSELMPYEGVRAQRVLESAKAAIERLILSRLTSQGYSPTATDNRP